MPNESSIRAFDVFLNGKCIDTVFYGAKDTSTPEDVKRSLVNHDGYHPNIQVYERRKGK